MASYAPPRPHFAQFRVRSLTLLSGAGNKHPSLAIFCCLGCVLRCLLDLLCLFVFERGVRPARST